MQNYQGQLSLFSHGARISHSPRPRAGAETEGQGGGVDARERCSRTPPVNKMNPSWLRRHPEERCPAAHPQGRQPQLLEHGAGTSTRDWQKWHGPKTACMKWRSPEGLSQGPICSFRKGTGLSFLSVLGLSEPLRSSPHPPVGSLPQLAVFLLPGSEF